MNGSEILWVLATLGFVLTLLGVALKLLRKFAPSSSTRGGLRMEVVQRLALGPKQGVAVIRVAERYVAISVGEGGINRLFELEASEVAQPEPVIFPGHNVSGKVDFRSAFTSAMKTAGLMSAIVMSLAVGSPANARAQNAPPSQAQLQSIAAGAISGLKAGGTPAGVMQGLVKKNSPKGTAAAAAAAANAPDTRPVAVAPGLDVRMGGSLDGGLHLSGNVGAVVMLGAMTLLPSMILMMTGFTRIFIVLGFLRQALGTQTAPPTQLVAGLALILTGFVMSPTINEVNRNALQPWLDGKIDQSQMLTIGEVPFKNFMLRQTRRTDLDAFARMSGQPPVGSPNDLPIVTLTSAFVVSELRTAFQIGFALFLPFIVIDIAVSSVLMSMGMFMLPPAMISLPFKLLLFVLVDGWSLVIQSLVQSFH